MHKCKPRINLKLLLPIILSGHISLVYCQLLKPAKEFDRGNISIKAIAIKIRERLSDSTIGWAYEISQGNKSVTAAGGYKISPDDTENGVPMPFDLSGEFHVASVSKTITAVAIAKLVELGKLSFEDKIAKYLPQSWIINDQFKQTTISELLTMKSGLDGPLDAQSSCYDSLKQYIRKGPDPKKVGKFFYQNISYGLLRIIIANAFERPFYSLDANESFIALQISGCYIDFVNKFLFKAAGLSNRFCKEPGGIPTLMYPFPSKGRHGYLTGRDGGSDSGDLSLYAGGLGWYLSVSDLSKFLRCVFFTNKILHSETLSGLIQLGFPFSIHKAVFGEYFGSGGDWMTPLGVEPRGGIHTYYYIFPYNIQVVVVTNSGPHGLNELILKSFISSISR